MLSSKHRAHAHCFLYYVENISKTKYREQIVNFYNIGPKKIFCRYLF